MLIQNIKPILKQDICVLIKARKSIPELCVTGTDHCNVSHKIQLLPTPIKQHGEILSNDLSFSGKLLSELRPSNPSPRPK